MDSYIVLVNEELRLEKVKSRICLRKEKLSLRATLPCKEDLSISKQTYVALGLSATLSGIAEAKQKARLLDDQVKRGLFKWEYWLIDSSPSIIKLKTRPKYISELLRELEKYYFSSRKQTITKQETWQTDYLLYFSKIPDIALSTELLISIINSRTGADTRSRDRCVVTFAWLARYLEYDFKDVERIKRLRGEYMPKDRLLPIDLDLPIIRSQIHSSSLKWAFGMMATYGLRNHEVFLVDKSSLDRSGDGVLRVLMGGKSRQSRLVPPLYKEWFHTWELWNICEPVTKCETNRTRGDRIGHSFYTEALIIPSSGQRLTAYMLRHMWAVRALWFGLGTSVAARFMGHDDSIHRNTYLKYIKEHEERTYILSLTGNSSSIILPTVPPEPSNSTS